MFNTVGKCQRKHGRPCEEGEVDEFSPASKRMKRHKLSFASGELLDGNCNEVHLQNQNDESGHVILGQMPNHVPVNVNLTIPQSATVNGVCMNPVSHSSFVCLGIPPNLEDQGEIGCLPLLNDNMTAYCPELNAADNPHYYQINGLLYDLHISRMQRLARPPNCSTSCGF